MAARTPEQEEIVDAVRRFVDREVVPTASSFEHSDTYPTPLVERMKELGLFGATIPLEYGGLGLDVTTYAMIVEELARGWMSLSGVLNTHMMLAFALKNFGTDAQRKRYLPAMASGEHRAALCLTEPHAGSDVQRIRSSAVRSGDHYVVNGSKMFITNAETATIFNTAVKTDPDTDPPYKGISLLMIEKGPGVTVTRKLEKLGYKGIDTCELSFDDYKVPPDRLIGGVEGRGLQQILSGLELGRINVAARGVGVADAALKEAVAYSQVRKSFGKPICEHQAIQLKLGDMATRLEAARLLTYRAAEAYDLGERCDMEAGMAKLFATEAALENSIEAMRIHGGYGYSKEFNIERLYRDAPLLIIGEGTNELQRIIIAKQLIERNRA